MSDKTILVIGTYDTKDDELLFMADVIRGQGGNVVTMDVSVLGDPSQPTDYSKHNVAEEGGSSIQAVERVQEFGCEVVQVVGIVDRMQGGAKNFAAIGLPLKSLLTIEDFGIEPPAED